MPDRDNFQALAAYTVVDPIANSIDVKAPDVGRTCFRHFPTHARLLDEKGECSLKILANSSWRCWAIRCPPPSHAIDLSCRAARDERFEGHGYPWRRRCLKNSSPEIMSP